MKLVATKDLKENVYKVKLNVIDITDTDREKFSDFGELTVDVGGVIKGEGTEQKYVPVQEPVTKTETQTTKETQLVFEEDGITPVYEEDGFTQKTQEVDVEKEVVVPVLDEEGNPVTQDKLDEEGKKVYQLVEEPIEIVLADLGKHLRKFPSEFPVLREFAVTEFGEKAEQLALAYIDIVKAELETKVAEFEDKADRFSGIVEIPLETKKTTE